MCLVCANLCPPMANWSLRAVGLLRDVFASWKGGELLEAVRYKDIQRLSYVPYLDDVHSPTSLIKSDAPWESDGRSHADNLLRRKDETVQHRQRRNDFKDCYHKPVRDKEKNCLTTTSTWSKRSQSSAASTSFPCCFSEPQSHWEIDRWVPEVRVVLALEILLM